MKKLRAGEGGCAAITTAKGRMESDLNLFCLAGELLLQTSDGENPARIVVLPLV